MNAEEIRILASTIFRPFDERMLIEIAAQLAELNEHFRKQDERQAKRDIEVEKMFEDAKYKGELGSTVSQYGTGTNTKAGSKPTHHTEATCKRNPY